MNIGCAGTTPSILRCYEHLQKSGSSLEAWLLLVPDLARGLDVDLVVAMRDRLHETADLGGREAEAPVDLEHAFRGPVSGYSIWNRSQEPSTAFEYHSEYEVVRARCRFRSGAPSVHHTGPRSQRETFAASTAFQEPTLVSSHFLHRPVG
ncbi:hypothetical protein [Rhizobium sullae]|uniref:hypothetical protein n=1 Tax=Rhizobium sullae TaxID=50338 RepID=UPI0015C58B45